MCDVIDQELRVTHRYPLEDFALLLIPPTVGRDRKLDRDPPLERWVLFEPALVAFKYRRPDLMSHRISNALPVRGEDKLF